ELARERVDRGLVGDVDAAGAHALDACELGQRRLVDVECEHARTFARERFGGRAADALAGSGHEGGLAGESIGNGPEAADEGSPCGPAGRSPGSGRTARRRPPPPRARRRAAPAAGAAAVAAAVAARPRARWASRPPRRATCR